MTTDRSELTTYEFRKLRARILAESDICLVCGHGASDAVDHVHPASKGGAKLDPDTGQMREQHLETPRRTRET
ncbi:hypothetical protein [Streptomyces sp. R35]|uniref:HNH endonuclease n=1 Tax=Streptomyces sp. R35 TaxID=3238630 RepID=A0AB39SMG6_9ACTN